DVGDVHGPQTVLRGLRGGGLRGLSRQNGRDAGGGGDERGTKEAPKRSLMQVSSQAGVRPADLGIIRRVGDGVAGFVLRRTGLVRRGKSHASLSDSSPPLPDPLPPPGGEGKC